MSLLDWPANAHSHQPRKRARSNSANEDRSAVRASLIRPRAHVAQKRPVVNWQLQDASAPIMIRKGSMDLLRRTETLQLQSTTPISSPLNNSPVEQQTEWSMDVDEVC